MTWRRPRRIVESGNRAAAHHERQTMHHHPELLLPIAHDAQRSRIDAAERHQLARSIRSPRRPFFAHRVPSPRRHGRLRWRQLELAVQASE